MLIGYVRVSKRDGSQTLDLQRDALLCAGVPDERIYEALASGRKDARPGLDACLKPFNPVTRWSSGSSTFEAELIRERIRAGLAAVRARGRLGGKRKMTKETLRMAISAIADPKSNASEVARRLGMITTTLYDYVNGDGSLKQAGQALLERDD